MFDSSVTGSINRLFWFSSLYLPSFGHLIISGQSLLVSDNTIYLFESETSFRSMFDFHILR